MIKTHKIHTHIHTYTQKYRARQIRYLPTGPNIMLTHMVSKHKMINTHNIYTHTHTYIHTCIHTYMHAYIHTYIHTVRARSVNSPQDPTSCSRKWCTSWSALNTKALTLVSRLLSQPVQSPNDMRYRPPALSSARRALPNTHPYYQIAYPHVVG